MSKYSAAIEAAMNGGSKKKKYDAAIEAAMRKSKPADPDWLAKLTGQTPQAAKPQSFVEKQVAATRTPVGGKPSPAPRPTLEEERMAEARRMPRTPLGPIDMQWNESDYTPEALALTPGDADRIWAKNTGGLVVGEPMSSAEMLATLLTGAAGGVASVPIKNAAARVAARVGLGAAENIAFNALATYPELVNDPANWWEQQKATALPAAALGGVAGAVGGTMLKPVSKAADEVPVPRVPVEASKPAGPVRTAEIGKTYHTARGTVTVEAITEKTVRGTDTAGKTRVFKKDGWLAEEAPAPRQSAPEAISEPPAAEVGVEPVSAPKAPETQPGAVSEAVPPKTPVDVPQPSGKVSVKNAVTEQLREAEGLAPKVERPTAVPLDKRMQRAKQTLDSGEVNGAELAKELVDNPRGVDQTEIDLLHMHLSNVSGDLTAARAAGDTARVSQLEQLFDTATKADQLVGTEQSRAFSARKTATDPYDLEMLLSKGRTTVKGWDDATQAKVITIHQRLRQGEIAEARKVGQLRTSKPVAKSSKDFLKAGWGKDNKIITHEMVTAARQRMRERAGRLNTGIDPTMVADLAIEIGHHVEAGVRFSYKTLHRYLKDTFGATDEEIGAAYQEVLGEERLAKAIKHQETLHTDLEDAIARGEDIAKPPPIEYDQEWMRLNEENNKLREQLAAKRGKTGDIKKDAKVLSNEERLSRSIAGQKKIREKLLEALKTGEKPGSPAPIQYDNEWVQIHRENVKLREQLNTLTSPKRSLGRRIRDSIVRTALMPTGWLASWDDSFIGRQGLKMLTYKPKSWYRAAKASLQAMAKEENAFSISTAIEEHPQFARAQQAGLEYTPIEPLTPLAQAEEGAMAFRSLENIPLLGKLARPFDRAYTIAANVMRHDAFYRMTDAFGDKWGAAEDKAYASFLNKLTGRGDLGKLAGIQPEMNLLFISPRKLVGDIQLLATPFQGPASVRKEAIKALVGYTAALGSLAAVVNASGKGEIEVDPGSSDFMKFRPKVNGRLANTRFDITGGYGTLVRTMWRFGEATIDYSRWGDHDYKQDGPVNHVTRYLKAKLNPTINTGISLWTGEDFLGEEATTQDIAKTMLIPWNTQDAIEAWQEDGAGLGVTAGIAAFWGIGSQSYED